MYAGRLCQAPDDLGRDFLFTPLSAAEFPSDFGADFAADLDSGGTSLFRVANGGVTFFATALNAKHAMFFPTSWLQTFRSCFVGTRLEGYKYCVHVPPLVIIFS